jgi:hypothetical protein
MFAVNVLLYGDYPRLAARCLDSIVTPDNRFNAISELRIGLNSPGADTIAIVDRIVKSSKFPVTVFAEVSGLNVGKYPLMRKMFYQVPMLESVDYLMWFDDDSYVVDPDKFWPLVCEKAPTADVLGSLYYPAYEWSDKEKSAFALQPWFTGMSLTPRPKFATGGWWVANRKFIERCDYPVKELYHNGGDVLLGEIVRQQNAKLLSHRKHVAINANESGVESRAVRRGITTSRAFVCVVPKDFAIAVTDNREIR